MSGQGEYGSRVLGNFLDPLKMRPHLILRDPPKLLIMRRLPTLFTFSFQLFLNRTFLLFYITLFFGFVFAGCNLHTWFISQVVRCNYTPLERKALVELISYIKGVGTMMERVDTLVADSIWEVLHAQVQEFVQNKLAIMLRTTFKKKKDLSR